MKPLFSLSQYFINFLRKLSGGLFLIGFGFAIGFGDGFGIDIIGAIKNDVLKEHIAYAFLFGVALVLLFVFWIIFTFVYNRLKKEEKRWQKDAWLNELKAKGNFNRTAI